MRGCSWGACVVTPGAGGCVCGVSPGGMRGCSGGVGGAGVFAPRGGHAWLLSGGGCAWDTTRYGDTINERAVRILLECILVHTEFMRL